MKLLNGADLAEFIKERQAPQVRALRQAHAISPKLVIIVCSDNPVIHKYVGLKQNYGADILVDVDVHTVDQKEANQHIKKLNTDSTVHGIIVQLPLPNPAETDDIVNAIAPEKDVDALGKKPKFDAATPLAILWLLSGYNVELKGKNIVLVGQGRLVGAPLKTMLEQSGLQPQVIDINTKDPEKILSTADIIITAAGKPGLITSEMVPQNCVVVDAGTTSENDVLKGDVAAEVYKREDLKITPVKGGVGPLTVAALFENVIRAAGATK